MNRVAMMLLLLTLAGCINSVSTPQETRDSSASSTPPVRCKPCMESPAEWGTSEDRPALDQGSFWAPDRPELLPALAYGSITNHNRVRLEWAIGRFKLDTALPVGTPMELPVYMLGHYPASHRDLLQHYVADPRVWEYHPAYALLWYVGAEPFGGKADVSTTEQVAKRAADLLGPLLMPDSTEPTVYERQGGWMVSFYRRIRGWTVYADRPLYVELNSDGSAQGVLGRRRPLLSASVYPLRSPEEAWSLLQNGKGMGLVGVGSPLGQVDQFVVKRVELAYHEGHADYPRQVMQPYFLFWSDQGEAVAIPAVSDAYVKW